jgi:phosphate-selective porin OprO and OprP
MYSITAALTLLASSFDHPGAPSLEQVTVPKEVSIYEQIWALTNLYEDEDSQGLQKLSLTGRFNGQYHWSDGDGVDDDGFETRRLRLGLEAKMWDDFTFKFEVTSASDLEPVYNGFSNFAVVWQPSEAFMLTLGKQAPRFSQDYSTSMNVHTIIERSQLLNQFGPDRAPGVSMQGKLGKLSYYTGLFTNTPSAKLGKELGACSGGASAIAGIGCDVHDTFHTDAADVHLEYLHSERNEHSVIYAAFDDGISTSLSLRDRRTSLISEVLCGLGGNGGDAVGINLMPGWFITEKLQLVARYQLAMSNGDKGLTSQKRYEKTVDLPAGDLYQAAYAGFNYLIYGPRLRLMGGVEYATMNGHDAWTVLLGIRLFWDGNVEPR